MPTKREREYYAMGYRDGRDEELRIARAERERAISGEEFRSQRELERIQTRRSPSKKRKLSAWNKFVRANSKKKIYQYANGKLKLKKMGIAFRKKRK